ncbi:MAG: glycoside hydrolase family 28 protein [Prevotellaceae bacterium]|nr:glycoside hydrolase family 28 protein [Candidatus Faecinaster equi]
MKRTVKFLITIAIVCIAIPSYSLRLSAHSPKRSIDITATGAKEGLERDNAAAIQKAIDKVSKAGGGTVIVPAGDFLSGPVELKSGVELHLERGARIVGIADVNAYKDAHPVVNGKMHHQCALIYADSQEDISVTGLGTIDGQGGEPAFKIREHGGRPNLIFFYNCKNVTVRDIRLENSAFWVQYYLDCEGVWINGVKVHSLCNFNNDGIDIDSKDVIVSNCIFDCDDDAICLKSDSQKICENVTVSNCIAASNCNAIKLGTASFGGFRNVCISNISIRRASWDNRWHWVDNISGITAPVTVISGIAVEMVDGGIAESVNISNISMRDVQTPIFIRMGSRSKPMSPEGSSMHGIMINGVTAVCESMMASSITGVPGLRPEDIYLSDIDITAPGGGTVEMAEAKVPEVEKSYPENRMFGHSLPAAGLYIRHADNVYLSNVRFHFRKPDARPLVVIDDCNNVVEKP